MKRVKRLLCAALAAVTLLAAAALAAPRAYAADYEDGTYTVAMSFSGGTGRVIWNSPVTITIKDGEIFADLVLSKPSGELPSNEWMECDGVRYAADRNTGSNTCNYYHVRLSQLGEIVVRANTTKMSDEHVIEYTLHIDDSAIPVKQAQEPTPSTPAAPSTPSAPSTPTVPSTPSTPGTPATPGTTEPATPGTPAESEDAAAFERFKAEQKAAMDKLAEDGDSEAAAKLIEEAGKAIDALTYDAGKSLEENEKAAAELLTKLEADLAAQRQKDGKDDKKDESATTETTGEVTVTAAPAKKLSTGAVIGIAAAAAAVIGAGIWLVLKQRKTK